MIGMNINSSCALKAFRQSDDRTSSGVPSRTGDSAC